MARVKEVIEQLQKRNSEDRVYIMDSTGSVFELHAICDSDHYNSKGVILIEGEYIDEINKEEFEHIL